MPISMAMLNLLCLPATRRLRARRPFQSFGAWRTLDVRGIDSAVAETGTPPLTTFYGRRGRPTPTREPNTGTTPPRKPTEAEGILPRTQREDSVGEVLHEVKCRLSSGGLGPHDHRLRSICRRRSRPGGPTSRRHAEPAGGVGPPTRSPGTVSTEEA